MNFNGVFTHTAGFPNTGSAAADFLMGTVNDSTLGSVRSEKMSGATPIFMGKTSGSQLEADRHGRVSAISITRRIGKLAT